MLRIAVLALLPSLSAAAQAPAPGFVDPFPLKDDPALQALVAETLARHPRLAMAEAERLAAEHRVPMAGALAEPLVALEAEGSGEPGWIGEDMDAGIGLKVSQELPWPGKRRAREAVAKAEALALAHPIVQERRALERAVRRAYTDLLLARANQALLGEQQRTVADLESLTRSRYAVGLAEQPDVLRAQAEMARLDQMRAHERGNERMAQAALNALLDRDATAAVETPTVLGDVAKHEWLLPSSEQAAAWAVEASPWVSLARAGEAVALARHGVARSERKPDLELGGRYVNRGALPDMWAVELGFRPTLWRGRKQQKMAAEAEAMLVASRARTRAVALEVRATAQRALAEYVAAVDEARAFEKGVLIADRLAVESTLASYRAGRVPFVSVLEAHTTDFEDRWEYLELLAHVLWHSADLAEAGVEE
ncbi:MAG: TolC family protein [Vicinamibacteria bacterium]|nr:TolC family protein [Vicinamibacteria bacterium]